MMSTSVSLLRVLSFPKLIKCEPDELSSSFINTMSQFYESQFINVYQLQGMKASKQCVKVLFQGYHGKYKAILRSQ